MYCIKCGKEIPDGENDVCEDCKKKVLEEIENEEKETEKVENEKKKVEEKKVDKNVAKKEKRKKDNSKKKEKKSEAKKDNKSDKDKKSNKKNIIIAGIAILVVILVLIGCFLIIPRFAQKPTTIGNIRNYGYTTVKGNWIYYIAPNEDSTQIGIFKIKTNGQEKQQIYMGDSNILSMNVKGNYLYFIGIGPEEYSQEDASDNKIYRMKTDGTDLQVINDNEFHNACLEMYVINNSIYYIGTDQNIYKMKLDGSNRELVSDNGTGYLGITDKYIFYNFDETGNEEYVTYMMDLDGSNPRPIIEGKRLYSIDVKDDYVYYTNPDKELFRTKMGSNEEERYTDIVAYNLNLNGKYLYYLNYENDTNVVCIYRVKADETSAKPEKIKAMDNASQFINVIDDYVYYMDYNDESGFINLVKRDGSEEIIQLYLLEYEKFYETIDEGNTEENVEQKSTQDVENTNAVENATANNTVVDTNTANTVVEESNTTANTNTAGTNTANTNAN